MTKTRRIQVPVSPADEKTIKAAAKLYKISAAEWIRRIALKAAQSDLSSASQKDMSPLEALEALCEMKLPVKNLSQMIEEGVKGRLKK